MKRSSNISWGLLRYEDERQSLHTGEWYSNRAAPTRDDGNVAFFSQVNDDELDLSKQVLVGL